MLWKISSHSGRPNGLAVHRDRNTTPHQDEAAGSRRGRTIPTIDRVLQRVTLSPEERCRASFAWRKEHIAQDSCVMRSRMIGRPSLSTTEMTHGQPSAFALASAASTTVRAATKVSR
jgi:hypothetical protein